MTRRIIGAVLAATMPVVASAQESARTSLGQVVTVGSRVRLRSSALQGQPRGLVVALDDNVLTIATDSGGLPVKVPLASVTDLEMSLGRKRNTLRGLGIGVASGLIAGLAFPVNANDCGYYSSENFCSRGEALVGGLFTGAVLGAGIGALTKGDRWSPVAIGVARAPGGGGSALGLSVAVRF
jgi:hypothetical protein